MNEAAFSARSAAGAIWRLAKNEPAAFRRLAVRAGLDTGLCALMINFGSLEPGSVPMTLSVVIVILGAIAAIDLFVVLPLRVSALVIGADAVKVLNYRTIAAMAFRGFKVFSAAGFAASLLLWPTLIALWLFGGQQDGLNAIIEGTIPLWSIVGSMLVYFWVAIRLFPIVPMRLIDETILFDHVWPGTRPIRFRIILAWAPTFLLFAFLFFGAAAFYAIPVSRISAAVDVIGTLNAIVVLAAGVFAGAATNAEIARHVRSSSASLPRDD